MAKARGKSARVGTGAIGGEALRLLEQLGVPATSFGPNPSDSGSPFLAARSPLTGEVVAHVRAHDASAVDLAVARAGEVYLVWRTTPAPVRGELVRLLAVELRAAKAGLGQLVTLEAGKVVSEGLGEVQEMIDICDFAVGLSRQLYGRTIATERPDHRMMETWHPIGPVGVITAFNFPVAVWAWNAALALVCGNPVIWKPSEKTPLTALAVTALVDRAVAAFGQNVSKKVPPGLAQVLIGGREIGERLVAHAGVPLVSATGSTAMGRAVGERLARRFGRSLLELGGNNAAIVTPSADLDLAVRAIAFAAMGTAGQRCTTLRRLIVHADLHDALVARLAKVYRSVKIGDPREDGVLVGPLIDRAAFEAMQRALDAAKAAGGRVTGGERVHGERWPAAFFVAPALVEMADASADIIRHETFAPILYVMRYRTLAEAIAINNAVPQGLASAIFTRDIGEAETFVSAAGSDCGIVNVNIGPSGAEIGGAFGGEKETGGGREAGSDAWKAYMRRATNTINYGKALPLAQGVTFDVEG